METSPEQLQRITDALILKASHAGILPSVASLLSGIQLRWGNAKTAQARKEGGVPIVELGRGFFTQHVQDAREGADVVMHELLHHSWLHLSAMDRLIREGYSKGIIGVAADALINAMLSRIGCDGFMKRYYPDQGEYAFLRPDSHLFALPAGDGTFKPIWEVRPEKQEEFMCFYQGLRQLQVTLESALVFFRKHFPQAEIRLLIGSHGKEDEEETHYDKDQPDSQEGRQPGRLFDEEEARSLLAAIRIKVVSPSVRRLFANIISKIAQAAGLPGTHRIGRVFRSRPPASLRTQDLVALELGKTKFFHPNYQTKEVAIFLDASRSVWPYLPFVLGLIASLRQLRLSVKTIAWAERAREIDTHDLQIGRLPYDLGSGTVGETVAQILEAGRINQAVILTDNQAGPLHTPVPPKVKVHVCLIGDYRKQGSFLDKAMVPNSASYELPPL